MGPLRWWQRIEKHPQLMIVLRESLWIPATEPVQRTEQLRCRCIPTHEYQSRITNQRFSQHLRAEPPLVCCPVEYATPPLGQLEARLC